MKMVKRRSQDAENFDLPLSDPRHLQLRDNASIGSAEWIYFLSWMENENHFDLTFAEADARLRAFLLERLPQSAWIIDARSCREIFVLWAKAKYRESAEGQRHPLKTQTKEELAVALFLETPSLTDESIRQRLAITEKQMQRWPLYQLARIEQKRLTSV